MTRGSTAPAPRIPAIPAVPGGVPRPRWSVMIPTYSCAGYLEEALASAVLAALADLRRLVLR